MKKIFLISFFLNKDREKIFVIYSKNTLGVVDLQEFTTVNLESTESFRAILVATLQFSSGVYISFNGDFLVPKDIHKIVDCTGHAFVPGKFKNKIDSEFLLKCFNRL